MRITKTHSYNIQIWVGLLENYEEDCVTPSTKTKLHTLEEVEGICQRYVNKEKHCVTVTPTKFIYTGGNEPGAVIGFIQYPRFERHSQTLTNEAIALAKILLKKLNQCRITITTPDRSIMLSKKDCK